MFGAAYNDIEVDLENGTPKTTSIQSPKWNLTGLVRYEIPVGPGRVALQYDIQHRSKHYFALTRLPTVTQKFYEVSNISVGWLDAEDRWMVTGFVNNLSDEEYLVQTFDLSGPSVFGMTEQSYGRPR